MWSTPFVHVAGKVLFHIPQISPFGFLPKGALGAPNFGAFKAVAGKLPFPVVFRQQNNFFEMDRVEGFIRKKAELERVEWNLKMREKLMPKQSR